jgi:hypothetical protein
LQKSPGLKEGLKDPRNAPIAGHRTIRSPKSNTPALPLFGSVGKTGTSLSIRAFYPDPRSSVQFEARPGHNEFADEDRSTAFSVPIQPEKLKNMSGIL